MSAKGETKVRVVGYCRTSGEGQRDNTSIPTQKKSIEDYCKAQGWRFLTHYVDESKSGAKIAGRDGFQRMIKDAALEKFEVIVAFDVTRFARDGVDILNNAKFLRENFSVHVVDTKGSFDSRPGGNVLLNFVHAGVSEYERLKIMERTAGGKIHKARSGEPWCASLPFGRSYDKATKTWGISERGRRYRELLKRYVAGEGLHKLVTTDFPEFKSSQFCNYIFRRSQISGTYVVTFKTKEINLIETVPVPAVPELITPEFAQKVKDRMEHRRTCNKEDFQKYLLTGYVRCGHCGRFLTGSIVKNHTYHRHHGSAKKCVFYAMREDQLVPAVLDYLFWFITDEAAFDAAVKKALPDVKERPALEESREELSAKLAATELQIRRLVDAVAKGADPAHFISKQHELKQKQEQEQKRLSELEDRLAALPAAAVVQREAMTIRLRLLKEIRNRDWRKLNYEDIRRYLIFVFGENPRRTGDGITVRREGRKWVIAFKGRFNVPHDIVDGRPLSHLVRREAARHNKEVKRLLDQARTGVGNLKCPSDRHGKRIP